jgi:hypothetical protein
MAKLDPIGMIDGAVRKTREVIGRFADTHSDDDGKRDISLFGGRVVITVGSIPVPPVAIGVAIVVLLVIAGLLLGNPYMIGIGLVITMCASIGVLVSSSSGISYSDEEKEQLKDDLYNTLEGYSDGWDSGEILDEVDRTMSIVDGDGGSDG